MKIYICFVFCVLAIYVRECESLKILKKIHDFLHPPQATTTTVPILPTFSGGEDYAGEDGRTSTTPWSEVGVGGVGPSDSFTTVLTPSNNYYNNENKNEHKLPSISLTSQPPKTMTTIESVHNADDYITEAPRKQPTDINTGDVISNNNYNHQQPLNSNNQEELTNNEKDRNSNTIYEHSTIPEEKNQPPVDPNKQQSHTTNNNFQPSTTEKTNSNQKNNETQIQGEIPLNEDGPIVFPSEADSGAYLEPTRKDIKDDGHTGSSYAESTTGRTAKAPVPVGDGGRVVIDAPTKTCPKGSQLDDGECREIS